MQRVPAYSQLVKYPLVKSLQLMLQDEFDSESEVTAAVIPKKTSHFKQTNHPVNWNMM